MGIPNSKIHTENGTVHAGAIKSKFLQAQNQINAGLKNGKLTEEEAASLRAEMDQVFADLTAFKGDDGKVGSDERIYTRQELNTLLNNIKTTKQS